jgi:ribonucleoside-diphosphate reductase alpha chain
VTSSNRPPYAWHNEASQLFMQRGAEDGSGYLLAGQTVQQRVRIIADYAQAILQGQGNANLIDEKSVLYLNDVQAYKDSQAANHAHYAGWADKFCDYMSRGWFSLSTPIWTNFGTTRGLGISCVTGDTWINTKHGGGKQARDIVIGDEVLTHKGRYRKVTAVIPTENRGNIYDLKVANRMTSLNITENHLVLTNLGWVRVDELDPERHLVAINRELEAVEERYTIDLEGYAGYETLEKEGRLYKQGATTVRRDRQVDVVANHAAPIRLNEFDEELAWAFGLWFAEGSLTVNSHKTPNGIRITVNDKDEKAEAARWLEIMTRRFGLGGNGYDSSNTRNGKTASWHTVNLNSGVIGRFFASFGKGCKDKLIPEWVIDSSAPVLRAFLAGMLLGDGKPTKNGGNSLTVANPKMLLQVYQIALKLGEPVSLQMQEKAGVLSTTRFVYNIRFRDYARADRNGKNKANNAISFSDGLAYAPIRHLVLTDKVETVYDFTVEEDHSFSAAGVVVHNCFGTYVEDTMESILMAQAEVGMMTKNGGGTSAYFGNVRHRGADIKTNGKSNGAVHFMGLFENQTNIISQGSRRGQFAAYLPVSHPDILEFLEIGSVGFKLQDISFGVCVEDAWVAEMKAGDKAKQTIWAKVLQIRNDIGYPYIFFTDNANNGAPQVYKDKGMRITHSNLCTEIMESDNEDESFVCDLMSMVDTHFEEWEHTDAVQVGVELLDAVMSDFIDRARPIKFMERAVRFAENQRALGVGQLGWHTFLQSKLIAFESMEAKMWNVRIAQNMQQKAYAASTELAARFGEPELLRGYGRRNVVLLAIAPTTSSAFILGQASQSIEPWSSNFFIKDLAKIKHTIKNPQLAELLESKGMNTTTVWASIMERAGSVLHLEGLTPHEKDVFKTFEEISQREIVIQAAQRQKYIDQGQSLNLKIDPKTPTRDVNRLILEAHELGLKSLYYQHSVNAAQEFARDILSCVSCE